MPPQMSAQFHRQTAIVEMIRTLPETVAWHAIAELSPDAQDDLFDFLRAVENDRCSACGNDLYEDDVELCGSCADRSEQIARMQEMCNASGVVFGERL